MELLLLLPVLPLPRLDVPPDPLPLELELIAPGATLPDPPLEKPISDPQPDPPLDTKLLDPPPDRSKLDPLPDPQPPPPLHPVSQRVVTIPARTGDVNRISFLAGTLPRGYHVDRAEQNRQIGC